MSKKIVRKNCQGCVECCGVLIHVENGKIVKIEGDSEDPRSEGVICPKGLYFKEIVYHRDRLKHPLKRVGERGKGKWKKVSWDEALDTIANKFTEIIKKYGPFSIATSYGGSNHRDNTANRLLMNALGSPNSGWTDALYCWGPAPIAEYVTYGTHTLPDVTVDVTNSNCAIVWGANPIHTYPVFGKDLRKAKRKGAKIIVIDPRQTDTASMANIWVQVRPGTDGALALGMLNFIVNEGLYDKEFVEKWCFGFDKLKERAKEYPTEKVSEITWVSREQIEEVAETYATLKPASIFLAAGLEQSFKATQIIRAVAILIAITGNLDAKGGNVGTCFPPEFMERTWWLNRKYRFSDEIEKMRLGAEQFPLLSGSRSPFGLHHSPTLVDAILTEKPYPVKAWYISNNLLLCHPDPRKVYEALRKVEFSVVVEFFMTPTTELADIVLPAATWLEIDEVISNYQNIITASPKAMVPIGECWDELKIVDEILKRMGIEFRLWSDGEILKGFEDYNNFQLRDLNLNFDDLKKKGYFCPRDMEYKKYEKKGFNTPSGKVELYSSIFEELGYDPLPYYREPPESPISTPELSKEYPFILIAGKRHIAYFHSLGHQVPQLRKLNPEPRIVLHPQTAEELGIEENDWVWIKTPSTKERVRQKVEITSGIHPSVVQCEAQWWYPEKKGPEYGVWESNINMLISADVPLPSIAGTTPLRGLLCNIYKAGSQ